MPPHIDVGHVVRVVESGGATLRMFKSVRAFESKHPRETRYDRRGLAVVDRRSLPGGGSPLRRKWRGRLEHESI